MEKTIDSWGGCYPSNWKGLIVEGAYVHPAKFSNKLIRKIYDHILAEGWVIPGSTIVDPFGGVGLGALDAMRLGLRWRGSELEERFVKLGNENIQFWNNKFGRMPKWSGDAVLLQGDSRLLSQVLCQAHTAVNLPPYADGCKHNGGDDPRQSEFMDGPIFIPGLNAAVSSPPYSDMDPRKGVERSLDFMFESYQKGGGQQTYEQFCATQMKQSEGYSASVGSPPFSDVLARDNVSASDRRSLADEKGIANTANISPIDLERVGKRTQGAYGGLVSSPPYADSINSNNGIDTNKHERPGGPNAQGSQETKYGIGPAQLGAMKATEKGFQASVTSPPFQATTGGVRQTATEGPLAEKGLYERHAAGNMNVGYGDTEGNIGTYSPDDFWISARAIVEQVFMVLEPGAHAVWVLKDYVKNKERVPFCAQWQQMCEAVGFVTLHEHHALLVRHKGISTTDMDGKVVSHEVSSKSFFRRLAEKKGSPKIDYEVILCMQKPTWPSFMSVEEFTKIREHTHASEFRKMYLNEWAKE